MTQLFKKAAVCSDLHMGLKVNSNIHNQDCLDYMHWFVGEAQKHNCDICLFLGDYFHNRNNTNLVTMNYGLRGLRILSDAFDRVIMIPGNHDLFYRDQRTVSSIAWAEHIPNIELLNEISVMGDCVFVPWIVQDEYKQIFKKKGEYMFGHFELPKFMMNAMVMMPEVGELRAEHFGEYNHVFTGHFHKRQTRANITYIGNAFPHNFGDAGDDDRGMMILPWGEEPQFITWPDAPKYRTLKISDLVADPASLLPKQSYIKLFLDTDVSYEEASYLKENLLEEYNLRELSLVTMKKDLHSDDLAPGGNIRFQSVDTIVQSQLLNISSEFYDSNTLLEIYKGL
jgi:DNA repair exonuclease SbcCD nuclease subunit